MKTILAFLLIATSAFAGWQWTNDQNQVQYTPGAAPEGGYLPGSLHEVAQPPVFIPSDEPQPITPTRFIVDEVFWRDQQTGSLYGERVVNGTRTEWQATASPWSTAFNATNKAAAAVAKNDFLADLRTVKSNLLVIVDGMATNIVDTQSLVATNFTGAQRQTINAMQAEQVDSNKAMRDLAVELRRLINAIARLERQQ